ncbi:hypothetical protein HYPSUDRAFT_117799, partial [Hypholoma sublateritium FD-334 SS-4]
YYSPNCSRSVSEPPIEAAEQNPFVPPPRMLNKRFGPRNLMDLNTRDYRNPCWWSRPWGWISFFPHEPDFLQPPFQPLSDIPHRLHRLPDGSGYEMPPSLAAIHYNAAALRPMNPWGFGYKKSRSRPAMVMRSIYKSRDWFAVWVAFLSYLIACAESVEADLEPYPFLAKKHWATHLIEQGVDRTLLDALISSCSYKERFLASWSQFHMLRKASNQRMEQAETTLERQKRLARERQPPTTSAKVFRWVKDVESDGYIREQVSKKWRQDTLADYSAKQARYDSFANEWDCSSEFGSDDES